jgi:hypothetical protein
MIKNQTSLRNRADVIQLRSSWGAFRSKENDVVDEEEEEERENTRWIKLLAIKIDLK